MVIYIAATYKGISDRFRTGDKYPLALKKSWFSQRLQTYQRTGYFDAMADDSLQHFENLEEFKESWTINDIESI